ncbi:MAG TPA: phosphoribosylformylglycinamidine cyclo-ligase [Thermomicrobiales bacterium]|nr:phosphoribosylformylglycinamidine cyclo-ligase [Thermomicrobiales bacterium]
MSGAGTTSAYRAAGVDIDAGNEALRRIRGRVRATFGPQVLADVGHFGGLYALADVGDGQTVLVASADGVGTKLKLAFALDRHDTIGADLVNHCVNDILACGARPLFFLDYFATGALDPATVEAVVGGLAGACEANGCALLGGETAELPGFYAAGEYDLAGFIVGRVRRDALVTGTAIRAGDVLLGLPSAGLHTNGYALARAALGLTGAPDEVRAALAEAPVGLGRSLGEALLAPHRSYLAPVSALLDAGLVTGMAHITGGGLVENVPRMLPEGLAARFDLGAWDTPLLFELIRLRGGVEQAEMYRVFNMGVGFVVACRPADAGAARALAPEARAIGRVEAAGSDEGRVRLDGLEHGG